MQNFKLILGRVFNGEEVTNEEFDEFLLVLKNLRFIEDEYLFHIDSSLSQKAIIEELLKGRIENNYISYFGRGGL
jgi:hypothetical protein